MCEETAKSKPVQASKRTNKGHCCDSIILQPRRLAPMVMRRLNDNQVSELSPFLVPIDRDWMAEFRRNATALTLVSVALDDLFGPSSPNFDDWKCSFNFPFLLSSFHTDDATVNFANYVLFIHDLRGNVDMPFYRFVDTPTGLGGNLGSIGNNESQPNSTKRELSLNDIDYLTDHLLGRLKAHATSLIPATPDFYGCVKSNLILYGKHNGDVFTRTFHNDREYEQYQHQLDADLGDTMKQRKIQRAHALLSELTGNELTGNVSRRMAR